MVDDYDPYDFLQDGYVWCFRCHGDGFLSVTIDDCLGDEERCCPVCEGEGQITRAASEKYDEQRKALQEIMAKAWKDFDSRD